MSRHILVAVVSCLVVLAPVVVLGADVEGKIQSVDTTERTVMLDNGAKIWIGDNVSLDDLKEGAEIRVSYEERDGKNVATSVEAK